MKIIRVSRSAKLLFGGGNIVRLHTRLHSIGLTRCRGWLYQRGMCHIHVRGFGLGLTINHPRHV